MAIGNVQAVIDFPEELCLLLSASGLTKERIANESRKLLAFSVHNIFLLQTKSMNVRIHE